MSSIRVGDDVPEVSELQGMLGKLVRVTLEDGRRVTGAFKCIDEFHNFVLGDTQEVRPVEEVGLDGVAVTKEDTRSLGSTMVPGRRIVKVEVTDASWASLMQDQAL